MRKLIFSLAAVSLVLFAEKALCRGTTFAIESESFNSLGYQDFRVKGLEPRTRGTGRFLSVDPGKDWDLHEPQSWNMYAYARNNPVSNVDDDGRSVIQFFVKMARGAYRRTTRDAAVRVARSGERHAVKVVGPGASREAKGVVREAFPGEQLLRHDPHPGPGERLSHWQPKKKSGGQVGYEIGMFIAGFIPVVGWVVDAEAANADEGEVMGAIRNAANSIAQEQYGKPFQSLTPEEQAQVWAQITGQAPPPEPKKEKDPKDPKDDPDKLNRW